jgi:hypothetical protein
MQVVNATLIAASASGNFMDYTVSLAPYDLFPALAVQQGQTTLLTNPNQMEVYIDNSTQQLNTQPLAAGSTLVLWPGLQRQRHAAPGLRASE